ncbi:ribokinase [Ruegeria sp. 2012CJ41-6]|uniref:Ribokinase n=1 Tax=Ruegeria spongiae TaxID=2942209 RepID=A0ABT0PY89_9RHOB|nr:ribokinase [Ruegeria spongiae]MCL6282569.1 ribokinase [Ruegeria spongiae]
MTIYNLGSINIDHLYLVDHLPTPGETLSARDYIVNMGGKGLNMTVAALRAGGDIRHVGAVGQGDAQVRAMLDDLGVKGELIAEVEASTGHAIVYVDAASENSIVIHGGANHSFTEEMVRAALAGVLPGDWLLLQNETNANDLGLKIAREKGMKVALVAAPFDGDTLPDLIRQVDLVSMNETETAQFEAAIGGSYRDLTAPDFLITYGSKGAVHWSQGQEISVPAFRIDPVDTTGAGDTFFGMFLARYAAGEPVAQAMRFASAGAALKVQKTGAAASIPFHGEVTAFLRSMAD